MPRCLTRFAQAIPGGTKSATASQRHAQCAADRAGADHVRAWTVHRGLLPQSKSALDWSVRGDLSGKGHGKVFWMCP
jgi:hypothetical protein